MQQQVDAWRPRRNEELVTFFTPVVRSSKYTLVLQNAPAAFLKPHNEAFVQSAALFKGDGDGEVACYPNGCPSDQSENRGVFCLVVGPFRGASTGLLCGEYRIEILRHGPGQTNYQAHGSWTWAPRKCMILKMSALNRKEVLDPSCGWLSPDGALAIEIVVRLLDTVHVAPTIDRATAMRAFDEEAGHALSAHLKTLVPSPSRQSAAAAAAASSSLDDDSGAEDSGAPANFSDGVLRCHDTDGTLVTFRVHRAILTARSTFFRHAFSGQMREAKTGVVDLDKVRPPIVAEVLGFLYAGRLSRHIPDPTDPAWVRELFEVAHLYDITSLTRLLEGILVASERPPPEEMVPSFLMARRYDLVDLQAHYAETLQANPAYRTAVLDSAAGRALVEMGGPNLKAFLDACLPASVPDSGNGASAPAPLSLPVALTRLEAARRLSGRKRSREEMERHLVDADTRTGATFNTLDYEVRPRLKRQAVANMRREELTAELLARGLSTEGNKATLADRLQASLPV